MIIRVLSRAGAGAMIATLALAGAASGHPGDKSFQRTYPFASALCARAASNTLGKRLEPQVAQVNAACSALQAGFASLQTAVLSARAQFISGLRSTRATVRAACAAGQPRPSCRAARVQARATRLTLVLQYHAAVRTYIVGVEANRRTFWSTIRSLGGGAFVRADRPSGALTL